MNPAEQPTAISHTLRIFKAEELSRQGLHREAEALLGGASNPPEDPVLLHALATVVTRQGDYERSRRLWRLLQTRQPGHREAEHMLTAIETWEERPVWVRFAPAGAAAVLVLGLAIWLWPTRGHSGAPAQPVAQRSAPVATPTRVTAVSPVAASPTVPYQATQAQPPPEEPAPAVMFRVPPAKSGKR